MGAAVESPASAQTTETPSTKVADSDQSGALPAPETGPPHSASESPGVSGDAGEISAALPWTARLKYRLPTLAGAAATVLWAFMIHRVLDRSIGWDNLPFLLPHELGGLAAGVVTPLALLWMVVAFFERGRQLRSETEALRRQLLQMTYPSDRAQTRLREVTDALRRQARDLTDASDEATTRLHAVTEAVRQQSLELARVSEDADLRAQAIAEALRRQTMDLQSVSERSTQQAAQVGDGLFRQAQALTASSDRASARAEEFSELLRRRSEDLSKAAVEAAARAEGFASVFQERGEQFARTTYEATQRMRPRATPWFRRPRRWPQPRPVSSENSMPARLRCSSMRIN